MSMFPQSNSRPVELEYGTTDRSAFNFFNAVYAWMAVGLAVTAAVAFLISRSPSIMSILFMSKFMLVALMLGAWGIAWAVQIAAARISAVAATALFMLYAAVIGAMISFIFLVYEPKILVSAFVLTGGTFAVMSIYGFVTKRDLSAIGSFIVMAIFGVFIASIVNIFIASDALSWIITYAVLGLFIGLTAYETQRLRRIAEDITSPDLAARYAIVGSLVLYISFINMFMSILRIMGSRK